MYCDLGSLPEGLPDHTAYLTMLIKTPTMEIGTMQRRNLARWEITTTARHTTTKTLTTTHKAPSAISPSSTSWSQFWKSHNNIVVAFVM